MDRFFADLGTDRAAKLAAVSTDMGPAFLKSVTAGAPQATVCIDPFVRHEALHDRVGVKGLHRWPVAAGQ